MTRPMSPPAPFAPVGRWRQALSDAVATLFCGPALCRSRPWRTGRSRRNCPQNQGHVMLYTADGNLRPLEEIEADVIRLAIGHYRGRMTEVARRLGIGRSTLYRKLSELGIDNVA